jgi:hypothetical protein
MENPWGADIEHAAQRDFEGLHLQNIRGDIERDVARDGLLQPGDRLMAPTFQLKEEHGYNCAKSLLFLKRTVAAVLTLRDHVQIRGFFWAHQLRVLTEHLEQP